MKKLFLQSGKLMAGEFPEQPETKGVTWNDYHKAAEEYDKLLSAAKASSVEVVNPALFIHVDNLLEGQLYDTPEGWTVEIEYQHKALDTWETVDEKRYNQLCIIRAGVNRKIARLIPIKEPISKYQDGKGNDIPKQSGIVATELPDFSKGWEGKKLSLLKDQETTASDRTEPDYTNFTPKETTAPSVLADIELVMKTAHNAAIDKALTAMKIEWREDRHEIYNAIAKLKI